MMATAPRHTIADRMAYLNLACRFERLCAVGDPNSHIPAFRFYSSQFITLTHLSQQP